MGSDLRNLRAVLERRKGQRDQIKTDLQKAQAEVRELRRSVRRHEHALEIIRAVALKTQQQLQYHISDITSMALEAIFPNPYELVAEFTPRRGKTECDLVFVRNGDRLEDPVSDSGGGAVDVASFALRVASWSMMSPRSRNVLILDEPFRFLSADLLPRASETLAQISKQLNLQIILVTHEEELMEKADKIFEVRLQKRISRVR